MLAFLDAREDACLRECAPGHITASALVLDDTGGQVLLTLHPRLGRWVQLGGHCEDSDADIVAAALREATEESGVDGLRIAPDLAAINVHALTCSLGVPTRHLDLQFVAHAPAGAQIALSDESVDLRWWPIDGVARRLRRRRWPISSSALTRRWSSGSRRRECCTPGQTRAPRNSSQRAPMSAPSPITPSRISARGPIRAPNPMIERSITLPASIRTPSKITAPSNRAPGPISAPRPTTVPPMSSAPGDTAAPSCTNCSPRWPPSAGDGAMPRTRSADPRTKSSGVPMSRQ